jgi:hypothetical protein
MSCTLTVVGAGLDIDEFVENTGIEGFTKKYKGDLVSPSRNKRLEYSFASIITSRVNFDNLKLQIEETEDFLVKHKNNLKCIATTRGIDFATIDFGANSDLGHENKAQYFFFPPSLLLVCAELKLGLELSLYSF